jgi:hypothetical protein
MGKSNRRATKNGVDDAMAVGPSKPGGAGRRANAPTSGSSNAALQWQYGGGEAGISMEALGGDAAAAAGGAGGGEGAAAVAPKQRALTAGLRVGKKTATVLRGITKRKKAKIAKAGGCSVQAEISRRP